MSKEVRAIGLHEYKEAAAVMTEVFLHDPVTRYFTACDGQTEEQVRKLSQEMYEYIVYAHIMNGLVTTLGDNYESLALWLPPGTDLDTWATLRSGLWRLYYKFGKVGRHRYFNVFMPMLHHYKAEVMGEHDLDSYYLVYIYTAPSARGKGYSRKLVEHVTHRADAEGKVCYLESTSRSNVAIYERFGFRDVQPLTFDTDEGEPPLELDLMRRDPQPKQSTEVSKEAAETKASTESKTSA